jgi:hypothetical protein
VPINDDRLKAGTLTIDGDAFATQATNVRLVPKTDDNGDTLEVLSGDTINPDDTTSWSLVITTVQDFDDPAGFIAKALSEAGTVVPYVWKPNATGVSFAGTVRIRPVEIGGDVNARLTTDAEWPCQEAPTPTYPA